MYVCVCVCVCECMCVCVCVCVCACACVCVYAHTHTHTCVYVQMCACTKASVACILVAINSQIKVSRTAKQNETCLIIPELTKFANIIAADYFRTHICKQHCGGVFQNSHLQTALRGVLQNSHIYKQHCSGVFQNSHLQTALQWSISEHTVANSIAAEYFRTRICKQHCC